MELRFPCASCSSHLPSILSSIPDAYFWLVVVWKIIDQQPPKAKALPISLFFVVPFIRPKRWDNAPPRDPTRLRLLSNTPLYCCRRQSFDCYVLPLNGNHPRPRPRLPLYFLMGLALAPQTREPTAAPPNPTARALHKPIGSGNAMNWGCRWPTHGGRGLKLVEGRAAWLMLVVVCCCCQQKKPHFEHLLYCRQDYVCRGFNEDKKNWKVYRLFFVLSVFVFSSSHRIQHGSCAYFSSCDLLVFFELSETMYLLPHPTIAHILDLTEEFSICTSGTLRRKG
jgi:hypothetical protein